VKQVSSRTGKFYFYLMTKLLINISLKEKDNHQGSNIVDGDDYEEEQVVEEIEDEDYEEPLQNTKTVASIYKNKYHFQRKLIIVLTNFRQVHLYQVLQLLNLQYQKL